jgi:DDE superfamily endonuclease
VDPPAAGRPPADLRAGGLRLQVGRILNSVDLKPHLVRGWLTRPADPEFFTKAAAVCALYRRCPPNAVVFSVDEKPGITARSHKHPDQPGRPGQRTRREFEYVRHGTVSIIAALNVHTGQVLAQTIERNNADTFIGFLRTLDTTVPAGTGIHLVMDNGSSHVAKKTKPWLAARPRFQIHHTPKHASWLNQSCSSQPSPGGCYGAASSPPVPTWPHASTTSSWPTTNTTPSPTAGPTTAPRSKPHKPRRTDAALHQPSR